MPAHFKRVLSFAFIAALAVGPATGTRAQSTPARSLLVLSKHDHTLSIVDPETLKVVGQAAVGADPHEVVASTDGRTAYVSIYGGGAYHTLNVIDLTAQKALADIDTGALNGPHGLVFLDGKVWFTAEGAKTIARYDPGTRTIDWIMGTGQNRTHMLYVTAGAQQIYTTNVSSATVSILERVPQQQGPPPMRPGGAGNSPQGPPPPGAGGPPRMDWSQTVIPVGPGDEGFDVSPDGRELWTANARDGSLSIIKIQDKKNVATIDAKVFSANRLKFTLDGKYVLISSLGDGDLVIYDVASRKEFKRVKIGRGAAGILMQPDGARAFIACTPDNYVAILDLKTFEVSGRINAGGEPDGLAWAERR